MTIKSTERVELRAPPGRKAKWTRAAERAGVSLSDWARRRLDDLADEELRDDDGTPTPEDIRVSLAARGAMGAARAERLRARIHAARKTPWHGRS